MRRRTFLAAVPAVALSAPLPAQRGTTSAPAPDGPGQGGAPAPAAAPLPQSWTAGEDRFLRPDMTPGDRPVGASFASRTSAYGLSGAAAAAHPLATQAGIDILKRGGSAVDAAIAARAGPRRLVASDGRGLRRPRPDRPLRLESGVPKATRAALAAIGWKIGDPDGGFGRYECIEHRREGGTRVYAAASEMRADGCALAY